MTERRPELPKIEVPASLAAAVEMPQDLDATVRGEFMIPDTVRRRRAGLVYVVAAAIIAVGIATGLPQGLWLMVGALVAVAGYHTLAGVPLAVREGEALTEANRAAGFAVGHAAATLGFDGWRARPVWNVLVFSADEPPSKRGLVRIDGIAARVIEKYVEDVPGAE